MQQPNSIQQSAATLNANDSLAHFRDRFYVPRRPDGQEVIYFTGNSLGLQPKTARAYVEQELKDWETLGVEATCMQRRRGCRITSF